MSIAQSLKKLTDPIRAREEEAALKRLREQPKDAVSGEPPRYRRRICNNLASDGSYCPTCLADTMILVKEGPG